MLTIDKAGVGKFRSGYFTFASPDTK